MAPFMSRPRRRRTARKQKFFLGRHLAGARLPKPKGGPSQPFQRMVGFIKQLVDECGMGDITFPGWGTGAPRESRFQRMHISHGQVMVEKRKRS